MKAKVCLVVVLIGLLVGGAYVEARQTGPAQGEDGWFWPGMGHGRMLRDFGKGCCRSADSAVPSGEPLTMEQAGKVLNNYLVRSGNQNLKIDHLVENGDVFEATLLKPDGSADGKIEINRNNGWLRRTPAAGR